MLHSSTNLQCNPSEIQIQTKFHALVFHYQELSVPSNSEKSLYTKFEYRWIDQVLYCWLSSWCNNTLYLHLQSILCVFYVVVGRKRIPLGPFSPDSSQNGAYFSAICFSTMKHTHDDIPFLKSLIAVQKRRSVHDSAAHNICNISPGRGFVNSENIPPNNVNAGSPFHCQSNPVQQTARSKQPSVYGM